MADNRSLTWVVNSEGHNHDNRYYQKTEIDSSATVGTSGASLVGVFDEFDNSTASKLQGVLKDFDSAINTAVAGGEVNVGDNIGAGGIGPFYDKVGAQLQFKKINTSDSHMSITESGSHEIVINSNATALNTTNTIVTRDASGNFAAGIITADLNGNSSTSSKLETSRTISLSGDVSGSIGFDGSANVSISATVDKVDGKDVDDNETSTSYLWTAGKIISYMEGLLNGLDWQESVKDKDLSTPPSSPATGDRYIIKATGTGAWAGHDNNFTEWNGSSWEFVSADEGTCCWVEDEDKNYAYNGTSWVSIGTIENHNNLSGLQGGSSSEYYHLTNSQHTNLTDGGDTTLHIHDSRYYTESESDTRFLRRNATSLPSVDETYNLGDSSHKWSDIYAVNFNGTATYAKYADLAEKYTTKEEDIEPGTVVSVSRDSDYDVEICNVMGASNVIGIVSTNPAFCMNDELKDGTFIGLKGRVPCFVQGPVNKGDALITGYEGVAVSIADGKHDSAIRKDTKIFATANESILDDSIELIEVIL